MFNLKYRCFIGTYDMYLTPWCLLVGIWVRKLVYVMACYLLEANLLSKPKSICRQLDPLEKFNKLIKMQ